MAASPAGTTLVGEMIDLAGNRWRLQYGGASVGLQCVMNDIVDQRTANVCKLQMSPSQYCMQTNRSGGQWYYDPYRASSGQYPWVSLTTPPAPIPAPSPTPTPTPTPSVPTNGTLNFGSLSGGLPASAFGWATGALFDNGGALLGNASFIASAAGLRPASLRINAVSGLAAEASAGSMGGIDAWLSSAPQWLGANAQVMMGVGPTGTDTSVSAAQRATDAVALAKVLAGAGHECFLWEVGNECDGMPVATYAGYLTAIRTALRNYNPAYKVGGPAASWWGAMNIGQLIAAVGAGNIDFFSFHAYPVNSTDGLQTLYGKAAGAGDVAAARAALRQAGVADAVPIWVTEYSQNGNQNGSFYGLQTQTTYVHALFVAMWLASQASDPSFGGATIWEACRDSYYGVIGPAPAYDYTQITPAGQYLAQAAKLLPGRLAATTCSLTNFDVTATVNGKAFAVQLVNYSQTGSQTWNPVVSGGTIAALNSRFDIGKANPAGASSSGPALPITVPAETVTIIAGTLQ